MKNFPRIVLLLSLIALGGLGTCSYRAGGTKLYPPSCSSYTIKGRSLFPIKLMPNFYPRPKWITISEIYLVVISSAGGTSVISFNLEDKETEELVSSEHSIMAFSIDPSGQGIIYSASSLAPQWFYHSAPHNFRSNEERVKWIEEKAEKIANWKTYLKRLHSSQRPIELNPGVGTDKRFFWSPCKNAILLERVNYSVHGGIEDTSLSSDHELIAGKKIFARLLSRSLKTYLIDCSSNKAKEIAEGYPMGFTDDCSRILFLEYHDTTIVLSSVDTSGGAKKILRPELGIPFYVWTTTDWLPEAGHKVLTYLDPNKQHIVFYNLESGKKVCYSELKLPPYFAISPDGQKVALFHQRKEGIQIEIFDWSKEINALLERIK